MPSDLSSYKVASGDVASSSKQDNMIQAIQDALNAIGDTSKMAWAAGAIVDLAQLKQNGATSGQVPTWNGSAWAPATPAAGGGGGGDTIWTHDTFTADVVCNATSEATANVIKATTSKTYDGNPVLVNYFVPRVEAAGTLTLVVVLLRDATVVVGKWASMLMTLSGLTPPLHLGFRDTPPAGAHTYTVKGYVSASNATMKAGAGGSGVIGPGYLRVFKDS